MIKFLQIAFLLAWSHLASGVVFIQTTGGGGLDCSSYWTIPGDTLQSRWDVSTTTVHTDTGCTTDVTSNGDTASCIEDTGALGIDITESGSSFDYLTSEFGTEPGVAIPTPAAGNIGYDTFGTQDSSDHDYLAFFMVVEHTGGNGTNATLYQALDTGYAKDFELLSSRSGANVSFDAQVDGSSVLTTGNYSNTGQYIVSFRWSYANHTGELHVDGTEEATDTTSGSASAFRNNYIQTFSGYASTAEVLVFTDETALISDDDYYDVIECLGDEYGITTTRP